MDPLASIANAMEASVANVVIMEALPPHQRRLFRPVARGGGGGGGCRGCTYSPLWN